MADGEALDPMVVEVTCKEARRVSLAVMRRLLALERRHRCLVVECYGCGQGETFRVRWTGKRAMPKKVRQKVLAAIEGDDENTQEALL